MNALIIESTIQTPYVCFDPINSKFEISGNSLPEDANECYNPLIDWLEKYKEQPIEQTNFYFKLDYFNTASSRFIGAMVSILDAMSQNHKVKIFWYYRGIDEDMQSLGEEYSNSTNVEFELVEI